MNRRAYVLLGLLAMAAMAGGMLLGWKDAAAPPRLAALVPTIDRVAKEVGVDPHLLRAMVAAESGGRVRALSRAGAVGLLQLMEPTAREQAQRMKWPAFKKTMLYEPEANLRLGAGYLKWLLARFDGDEVFAVAAYNAGLTKVRRWARRALDVGSREVIDREGYAETRRHVAKVFAWRDAYAARPHS